MKQILRRVRKGIIAGVLGLTVLEPFYFRAHAAQVLVPTNAVWSYLDDGSNQGIDWISFDYDEFGWLTGPAELGYGDDIDGRPEATVVGYGPDPEDKYISTYFRHFFEVTELPAITNLILRLLRDDGAVVYLNQEEIFRSNMPTGSISYLTLADNLIEGAEETEFVTATVDPTRLLEGLNLLAVEIHQKASDSSDISFALELVALREPSPPRLTRGPYLQSGTPRSVTIRWRTAEPAESRVQFGLAAGTLNREVLDTTLNSEHIVTLDNLVPDTKYFYAVGTSQTNLAIGSDCFFVTTPVDGKPTRIWVIGDSGTASPQARAVYDRYREFTGSRYTDLWLMLGDNAYGVGTDAEYQRAVFDMYPELLRQTVLWSTMGNHETYSLDPDGVFPYLNIFSLPMAGEAGGTPSGTEYYYSFDYGNIHFVCLDSEESPRLMGGSMLTWLEEDLAANTKDWLIAFWHSPPYSKGSHDSDRLADSVGRLVEMRENIVPVLESYGVDLVLCGHSHNYERSYLMDGHYGYSQTLTPSMVKDLGSGQPADTGPYLKPDTGANANQGTVYVVAGSSGWATFATGRHPIMHVALLQMGSLILDLDGHRLDAKFLRETGAIDDHFTILKGASPAPFRVTTLQQAEGQTIVRWKSLAGKTYQVEQTADLEKPQWIPASEPILAYGATTSWTNSTPVDPSRNFYRVVQIVD